MCSCRRLFMFLGLIYFINFAQCTEFVPVYMWSNKTFNDIVPALTKISQDTFKDDLLEQLKYYDFIVVFAEQTLSPEDFAQRDQTGGTIYPNLEKLKKKLPATYLPYVQNPVNALKNLDAVVSEISISKLRADSEIPKTDILIVNLDDVQDAENRLEMLARHDKDINDVCNRLAKRNGNVLALYTAYHASWVGSEDAISSRRRRSLLQTVEAPVNASGYFYNASNYFLYYTNASYTSDGKNYTTFTLDGVSVENWSHQRIVLYLASAPLTLQLIFGNESSAGYWYLNSSTILRDQTNASINSTSSLYAPRSFSFHCGDQLFDGINSVNLSVLLKDFQIQLFFDDVSPNNTRFGDPYDCVGFTSIPIWSGLFITAILLMILTFGITMMMDIRTMDKFDDAKGKTITINAE